MIALKWSLLIGVLLADLVLAAYALWLLTLLSGNVARFVDCFVELAQRLRVERVQVRRAKKAVQP